MNQRGTQRLLIALAASLLVAAPAAAAEDHAPAWFAPPEARPLPITVIQSAPYQRPAAKPAPLHVTVAPYNAGRSSAHAQQPASLTMVTADPFNWHPRAGGAAPRASGPLRPLPLVKTVTAPYEWGPAHRGETTAP